MRASFALSGLVALVMFGSAGCGDDDAPAVDGGPLDGDLARDLGGGDGGAGCVGAGDGAACELPSGVAAVCVSGSCAASACGDSVVDARTETCDDGNSEPGDGCEPDTCRFTCATDAECTNGNECDGTETCALALHRCQGGTRPAVGAACTTAAGIAGQCNAAVVCGPAGCGNAIVGAGEDCDDGNTLDGDGCDNDCTFSCALDADCDDGNVCNGTETCDASAHQCSPGSALDCADTSACTADECDPSAGCVHPLIDGDGDGQAATSLGACGTDCDDANAARYSGAEEICDGVDNNCNGAVDEIAPTWYVDCDGDTYASSLVGATMGCAMPSAAATGCPASSARSWTNRRPIDLTTTDCYDANADVKPLQTSYFTTAAAGRSASVDFDYNCSSVEDKQYTHLAGSTSSACGIYRGACAGYPYWLGTTVPVCGALAPISECLMDHSGVCVRTTHSTGRQGCR